MLVQVHTDHHIYKTDDLASQIEAEVQSSVGRFGDQITRVEVHLHDLNAHKGGIDKRCVMEARVAGHSPIAVSDDAASIEEAMTGAAEKLERSLEHSLGKLREHKGQVSMGGDQTI